jgi:hypothetical protein
MRKGRRFDFATPHLDFTGNQIILSQDRPGLVARPQHAVLIQHPLELRGAPGVRLANRASRLNTRATCDACHCRLPAGVGTPRAFSASAMPLRLVIPLSCNSLRAGARSRARATARAVRALSAMLRPRWPMWRPVGMLAVCQPVVNSSAANWACITPGLLSGSTGAATSNALR